ncbi:MAG: hypothetical protein L3J17_00040 [Candidatus Jettenia sp.]|nr:MAG: hypothetical protein L3J17_00040 [Candidatus Jettenia sp.]
MLQKSFQEKPSEFGKKKVCRGVILLKCLLPGDGIIRDKQFLRWQGNVIKHFYEGNSKNAKRLSAKFIFMSGIYSCGGFAQLNLPYSL